VYPATPVRPLELRLPSPLAEWDDGRLADAGIRVYLKRDDLINPDLPGNKWRKLKYNLAAAKEQGRHTLLTFGGAYSNHIRATAAAGSYFGFSTIGVIRGEEHLPLNPSLSYAASHGMRLTYLDRAAYRNKASAGVISALRDRFGDFYLLPEGGSNEYAVRGCAEIPAEIAQPFDLMCCPCGTGGTLAGISCGLSGAQRALGFSALKGGDFLESQVRGLQLRAFRQSPGNWTIEQRFHFGGYARRTPSLDSFIADFSSRHGLELNWIYSAKMMYGIYALAAEGRFPRGTTIVALITG
jgi:1-aminocyclopropane-1-carboxylate deaminase/D-cysteine desulfhydrase-like pyridoxal-dependent ACC family enzyme